MDYKSVIESKYNRANWQKLLHDIFGSNAKFWANPSEVLVDESIARKALSLGTVTLKDGCNIAVFEVELSDTVDIERNRRGIRDMLLSQWRGVGYAGAFMFCYRKDESVLRFSYVSEASRFDKEGNYKNESTDPRRCTYLLGEGHRSRTAIQQFEKLRRSGLKLSDLTNAFSVEAVGDMFFAGYKKLYEDIIHYVTGRRMVKVANKWQEQMTGKPCRDIMDGFAVFADPEKYVRNYVKKLMGRLVFLQFLQKKGWMGVPVDKNWGEGDPEFVQSLFDHCDDKDHFVDNILESLFNDLNTRRADDVSSISSQFKVPYLNGGLFERDETDEVAFPLPARFMQSILEFFSSYNFTIDENDPDDAEVGVDPEMLGRIFENLLEDNKDKGAFYTPKEIVDYMCRESLIAYLQTDIGDNVTKDSVRHFVTSHDVTVLGENADWINQRLRDVKICDPAIGSGAFPMGLLRELFLCRSAIEGADSSKASEIKKHIIQQNIYGVDIEGGAVDIARLRFWLALIVDEDTPQALPNLDFKIMQGNSLIESFEGFDLSRISGRLRGGQSKTNQLILGLDSEYSRKNLLRLLREYFSVTDHQVKVEMRQAINNEVKTLIRESIGGTPASLAKLDKLDPSANQEFFLWHTWFKDIFDNGGFDIVIGNPPYGAKYSDECKLYYKQQYITAKTITGIQKASLDTFTLFIEHGYNVLKKNGNLAFIVPIALTSSDSLSGIHRILLDKCDDIYISSYAVRPKPVFEGAVVNTSILLFTKTESKCTHLFSTKMHRRNEDKFNLQYLVDHLQYTDVKDYILYGRIAKIGTEIEKTILGKIQKHKKLSTFYNDNGTPIYYRTTGGRYFKVVTNYPTGSTKEKPLLFESKYTDSIGCILSSNLSFWFYQIYSNNLDWKTYEIENFTLPTLNSENIDTIEEMYGEYLNDIEANAIIRTSTGESKYNVDTFKEYKIVRSKSIIDEIDDYIGPLYGLTTEEIDFIKNYELEFRMAGE